MVRVRECYILSVNFIRQQQNKSFDVSEIILWLEFADCIFQRRQATAGNTSAFAGYTWVNLGTKSY